MVHQERARTTESGAAGPEVRAALVLLVPGGRRGGAWPVDALAQRLNRSAAPLGGTVRLLRLDADDRRRATGGGGVIASVEGELDAVRELHGPVPSVLVGAGRAARTALWAAGHPAVSAVCLVGLRLPGHDPHAAEAETVDQLTGRRVLMVDGGDDPRADPELSYRYAVRAQAAAEQLVRFEVHGGRDPLRGRATDVRELVTDWALATVFGRPAARALADAAATPPKVGLRMPLADGFTSRE